MTSSPWVRWAVVVPVACGLSMGAVPAGAAAHAVAKDPEFAGYQLISSNIRTAAATFVIPTITCKQNESGVGPSVIIVSQVNKKTNTYSDSGAGIGVACEQHEPVYESIIDVNGTSENDFTLAAGDTVKVAVSMGSKGTKVSFDDVTANEHLTKSGKANKAAQVDIGDLGLEINHVGVKLDPFTTTSVAGAKINGQSLTKAKATRTDWTRKTTTLIAAGPLKNGTAFTLTFDHS